MLKGIALLVGRAVRRDELLARYGGDELAVVLPETSIEAAAVFCERIRSEVESEGFEYDDEPLRATISIGATSFALPTRSSPS